MIFNSLKTNITIGFLITMVLFVVAFLTFLKFENDSISENIQTKYINISNHLKENRLDFSDAKEYVESLNFKEVYNPREVLRQNKVSFSSRGFESFKIDEEYYIHILTPHFRILFKDLNKYETNIYPYVTFFIVFSLLVFIYIWTIKAIKPLETLKNEIIKFSEGDLKISCKSDKKDEIAQVANEFDNAVRKIELLLESRQLFLRTVMHELKTPIAKGRIVSELVDDEKQANRLKNIFQKLDFLINDFAKVEQVVSKNFDVQKQNYYIEDILENAKNMLMLEKFDEKVEVSIDKKKKISMDKELMSLVFKNLIDNAFKYSSNGKIEIVQNNTSIKFISLGNKLEKPFEEYFTPFHNNIKNKNHGMGLGLYIVKSILDMHDMNFSYEYIEDRNVFIILI